MASSLRRWGLSHDVLHTSCKENPDLGYTSGTFAVWLRYDKHKRYPINTDNENAESWKKSMERREAKRNERMERLIPGHSPKQDAIRQAAANGDFDREEDPNDTHLLTFELHVSRTDALALRNNKILKKELNTVVDEAVTAFFFGKSWDRLQGALDA